MNAGAGLINARIRSFAFSGIEARPVWVEVQVASGLPAFLVVGLPDKAVGEARERVRAALTSIGLALPAKRIVINLVPADLPKEGSHFDLPIALALLAAMGVVPAEEAGRYAAMGELSLDGGSIRCRVCCPQPLRRRLSGLGWYARPSRVRRLCVVAILPFWRLRPF